MAMLDGDRLTFFTKKKKKKKKERGTGKGING